jgi:hypothetical protein
MAKKTRFPVLGSALMIGSTAYLAYKYSIGPWLRKWGADKQETLISLPGDELVPDALFSTTRALTIQAQPDQVWPWIAQMGQGRGGLYSYDFLENLMGLDIHSSNTILPEFSDLKAGDTIPLEPSGSGYTVHEVVPGQYLLLFTDGTGDTEMAKALQESGTKTTWLFLLRELPSGCTRLVVRWRAVMDPKSSLYARLMTIGIEPIEFMMERKMMLGIKQRAEKLAADARRKKL